MPPVEWEGCRNARDLGGLPLRDGGVTRYGALVRSSSFQHTTGDGWEALLAHGVRTLIDLRTRDQREAEIQRPPPGVTTVHVPLEEGLDDEPWFAELRSTGLLGTPLYFVDFVRRHPDRVAAAVAAVARADPGGVVVHCGKGRDRTGLITMLVLDLVGVVPGAIADDYLVGDHDDAEMVEAVLGRRGTTARAALMEALAAIDPERDLAPSLTAADVAALRERLTAPASS